MVTTTTHFKTWRFPYMLQSRASVPFKDWTDWEDVVCLGFWTVDWFSAYAPCTKSNEQMTAVIDDDGNEGTLDALEMDLPTALDNDAGLGDVNAGARFAVLNSYDGLDAPGEYVLKRSAGSKARLYFIPPTSSCLLVAHKSCYFQPIPIRSSISTVQIMCAYTTLSSKLGAETL